MRPLTDEFFDRPSNEVARSLLAKIIRRRVPGAWLSARVIEVEAYERAEPGSHASLGRTPSREPLFAPPGTIYMYYARGGDSLNVSCAGEGNAVLIKSAHPYFDRQSPPDTLAIMQRLNPPPRGAEPRPEHRICGGQTLLCRALGLRVPQWTGKRFDQAEFFIDDVGDAPDTIIQTLRLGIPPGRDEGLPWRYIDERYLKHCTSNPTTRRAWREGVHWWRLTGC